MQGHRGRVGTQAWSSHLLTSGSRDRNILQRDIRAPEDFQHKLLGHRSEAREALSPRFLDGFSFLLTCAGYQPAMSLSPSAVWLAGHCYLARARQNSA